jgi:hypothetical protein
MNTLIKKIFPIALMLLLNACAHHSGYYYPGSVSYGGGYTVIERDYYRSGPGYGYYGPVGNHFHNVYQPRWQGDYGRAKHDHYHPSGRPQNDSHHWAKPNWQHENHKPHREDHKTLGYAGQPRFRNDNRQGNRPTHDHAAPAGGHFDKRQSGGARDNRQWRHENHAPHQERRGTPEHSGQQRQWNGDRQPQWNRGNDRRTMGPGQEQRQRPGRGNGNPQGRRN